MNAQTMINNIKDNLGNRANGRIGQSDVDTAALQALNYALPHLVVEAQPDYYNRQTQIYLDSAKTTKEYDLPLFDLEDNPIKIKDIYSHRCTRNPEGISAQSRWYTADGTDVSLVHLNWQQFVQRTVTYNQNYQGTPTCYALWGKENTLHLDYRPSEDLLLELYVEVYPEVLTADDLQLELPIDDQWDLVVEAFATKHLYLKLQQVGMYQFWDDLYQKQKEAISRMEYEKQSHNLQKGMSPYYATDPTVNPLYTRWN